MKPAWIRRHALLVGSAGAITAGALIRGDFGLWLISVGGVFSLVAVWAPVRQRLALRRWNQLRTAVEAEDIDRARGLLDELSMTSLDHGQSLAHSIARAQIAIFDERYRDARDILEKIDPSRLGLKWQIGRDNALAWAMAHDGAAVEAVAIAERAVAALTSAMSADFSSYSIGTLGIVELKAGRLAEARENLERALAVGGGPRLIASRAFYLGETLVALGHLDEAAEAYEKASRAMPEGRYGLKARAALTSIAAKRPYRG